jgi:predicted AAA+ superfamily ATPase
MGKTTLIKNSKRELESRNINVEIISSDDIRKNCMETYKESCKTDKKEDENYLFE